MRKMISLGILCSIVCTSAMSQYTLDSTRRMSPGVVYKHYKTTSPIRRIHLMEIDLTESTVNLQAVKAGDTINGAEETVPVMYKAHDNFRAHDVTAAINSDFFTSNLTIKNTRHMMIGDGEILYDTMLNRTVFGITESRSPFITKLNGAYSVTAGATTRSIDHINRYGGTDQLVMYNRFKGDSTHTKPGGTEIKIVPVNGIGDWKANATISCKVLAKSTTGNMAFDSGQAVLYGLGTAQTFLNNLNVNDVISLNLQVIDNSTGITNIKQLSGGWLKLVNDGVNYVAISRADENGPIPDSMAPRTAIGYNQAKNKIYFVVVDGRRPGISEGMTLPQLADFMIFSGSYQALNFDGGGSSTMMGSDMLKNLPSDAGGARKIASCLLAYLSSITLDDFENGVGHFNRNPNYSSTTVGVSTTSVVDTAKTCHSGYRSLIVKLYDNTAVTTAWKARILSGDGENSKNRYFDNHGTISFYMRTETANTNAKVRLWLNDSDGIELSPQLNVINDGQWHKYVWNLTNFNGTTYDTGNGVLNSNGIRLNSIEFTQPNTANTWFIFFDDIMVDPNGTETTGARMMGEPEKAASAAATEMIQRNENKIIVYPNPGTGIFTIDFKQEPVNDFSVKVLDTYGKKLSERKYSGGTQKIDLGHLPKGVYILYVNSTAVNESFKVVIK
ncbi:phosphodiester glycosidase family protein [Niastella sp. OAS944]|uniref:phosphodiester glycosidase family protein n=1 Tax=Niastella sp. OAS944 TaxID=2664089 RepID=UPI0034731A7A|nr:hypothetical protein [Chitinophagaceae bacterium OAS944]